MTVPLPQATLDCPAAKLLDRMASRWVIPVLAVISETPIRFNQLRRELDGISQRMLSQTLKILERDGLISRTATATVPLTVEYALTPMGRTLIDAFWPIRVWSDANYVEVTAAQARFDRQQACA
jgi:DNA-binding HxlR family transcriptional regulator